MLFFKIFKILKFKHTKSNFYKIFLLQKKKYIFSFIELGQYSMQLHYKLMENFFAKYKCFSSARYREFLTRGTEDFFMDIARYSMQDIPRRRLYLSTAVDSESNFLDRA